MARSRRGFRSMADINITSLVDVTLTLLIIFMLTAPYIQGGVEVDLPEAATRTQVKREGPVISITSNRQVFFQDQLITRTDLPALLAPWEEDKDIDARVPALRPGGALRRRPAGHGRGGAGGLPEPEPGGGPARDRSVR